MRAWTPTLLVLLIALAGCGSGPTVRERSASFTVACDPRRAGTGPAFAKTLPSPDRIAA